MSQIDTAIRAVFLTLRDFLPARLLAADETRRARVLCAAGPYTLPAGEWTVGGETVTVLVPGSYTAGEVAQIINDAGIDGITATDSHGRLVLTGPLAGPNAPSVVKVGGGPVAAALGLSEEGGFESAVRLAIGTPAPMLLDRQMTANDARTRPTVALAANIAPSARPVLPVSTGLSLVSLRLVVVVPGWPGEERAQQEAASSFADCVVATILEGDGRGPCMVGGPEFGAAICRCTPRGPTQEQTVSAVETALGVVSLGTATIDLEIEVLN